MSVQNIIPNLPKWQQPTQQNSSGDKLNQDLSGLLKAKQQADDIAKGIMPTPQDQFTPSSQVKNLATSQSFSSAYQYSETMSLKIETRDGDKVTVDFRQLYEQYQSFNRFQSSEEGPKGVRYFEGREAMEMTAFEERFAFSVQGELDEDELRAIFSVFEQVDRLANSFFNGDIEKALQQADELDIDFGQLKSVDLDLQRTEMRATAYQQTSQYQSMQDKSPEDYGVSLSELPPYLENWQAAIEKLDEQFANAREMFDDMMSGTLAQRFPEQGDRPSWFERVQEFHDKLADWAGVPKSLEQDGVVDEVKRPVEDSVDN